MKFFFCFLLGLDEVFIFDKDDLFVFLLVDIKFELFDEFLIVFVVVVVVVVVFVVVVFVMVEVGWLLLMDGIFLVDVLMKLLLFCFNCFCCFGEKDR